MQGQVTDPSGAGVEDAEVTMILHETTQCSSAELSNSTVTTLSDGSYDAGPGIPDTEPDFEPREVCLDVRAEPPADRTDLSPAEEGGIIVTLRTQTGEDPLDVVEVDLTLPSSDGG